MKSSFLSIIIPAFNEEERLPRTLDQIRWFIDKQSFESEVIVVENGSTDGTYRIGKLFAEKDPRFQIIHLDQRGKGLAVKQGMLQAHGMFCFMCDADLSMPVDEIVNFLPPEIDNFDVAIASREAPGAHRYHEPVYRHVGGRAINFIIRLLALPGLHDTQCGFKCFRESVVGDLFSNSTLTGWSFDVEILYIAKMRGYRIVELPIPWYFNPHSKLSLFNDTIKMISDILLIRKNASRGIYNQIDW